MTRRSGLPIDEVAVARCAAGGMTHHALTVEELTAVIHQLEPWGNDVEIGDRIGGSRTFVAAIRRKHGIRRLRPPAASDQNDPISHAEAERILGQDKARRIRRERSAS